SASRKKSTSRPRRAARTQPAWSPREARILWSCRSVKLCTRRASTSQAALHRRSSSSRRFQRPSLPARGALKGLNDLSDFLPPLALPRQLGTAEWSHSRPRGRDKLQPSMADVGSGSNGQLRIAVQRACCWDLMRLADNVG